MQTSTSPAPVEVFWNSFDFSQLLNWGNLAFRLRRRVRVHTSSGSLLIWCPDGKAVLISLLKSSDSLATDGPAFVTLSISRFRDHFPLLFDR